ncbi:unnamed protein product [Eruca vesicaria subsp. sativa]|uniref:Uncharacterized protein n=1 Tax=Eruca vesicaria subsp. sativa TaxID=29727 RepID=A0ABC8KD03_ERUVS|nr:unnamed protein product [Eruca vesicaria subsp. sativa]
MGLPNPGPSSKAVLWKERTFIDLEGCGNNNHNMFYNECSYSSSPKSKFYGTGYTYPNGGRSDYRPGKPSLESNGKDVKFVRDLNLNVTLFSNTPVVEVRKDEEERLATLPWLVKPKSACNSEVADGRRNQKISDAVQREAETEKINTNLNIPRDECNAERDKVRMMLDINEPCEPLSDADEQLEEQTGTKVSVSNKCHIDLNMSVSEEEEDEIDLSPHLLDIDIAQFEVFSRNDGELENEFGSNGSQGGTVHTAVEEV